MILSMEGVDFIDTEGADTIKAIAEAGNQYSIDLHLARVKPQVLEVLERDGALDIIGPDRIHADIAQAVDTHLSKYPSDAAAED